MDKLVTRQSRLADPNHGTAIKSFKKSEDQKSKLLAFLCRHQHLLAVHIEVIQFLPTQLSSKPVPTNLNSTLMEYVS